MTANAVSNAPLPFAVSVYGDVDLNYVDGSSIWLVSLVSVLSKLGVDVHVVLKADINRRLIVDEIIALPNVTLHEPSEVVGQTRLHGQHVVDAVAAIDEAVPCRVLITRGRAVSVALAATGRYDRRIWPYLTDIPQQPADVTEEFLRDMDEVFSRAGRVLCQTEQLRSFLVGFFPEWDAKMLLLPPMIPDSIKPRGRVDADSPGLRLFYAGKFAPAWGIEELVGAVQDLRKEFAGVELTVAGDKIHRPADDPGYESRVRSALMAEGVNWLGAIERSDVLAELQSADLAVSVRDTSLNASRELSTKLLEYCASGVPVIANRNLMHEELFGADYPFLVDGYDDLAASLRLAITHRSVVEDLREAVADIAGRHSYSAVARMMAKMMEPEIASARAPRLDGLRIGVASHDLKFATALLDDWEDAGATVRIDKWEGHNRHDEAHSHEIVDWADVVFCEWALANAAWYSKRSRPDQPVFVRLHRTEIESTWPYDIDIDGLEKVFFVGEHIKEIAAERFSWPLDKLAVIPNLVDQVAFDRDKLPGAEYNLGLLGFLPRLKRLDLALDLLEAVRAEDDRYRLIVKGSLPWDLDWVWTDDSERAYFESQFERIRTSPLLGPAVTFDRAGSDVPSWFRKIGWVLSPSDVESFHLAMLEGMLSRAIPVALPRSGVEEIFGAEWVHPDITHASRWILDTARDRFTEIAEQARSAACASYFRGRAESMWREVLAVRQLGESERAYGHEDHLESTS